MHSEATVSGHTKPQMNLDTVWESFYFPTEYYFVESGSHEPFIFFVIEGKIDVFINVTTKYTIHSEEMFMVPNNASFKLIASEPTRLMTCLIPVEFLFSVQNLFAELAHQFEGDPKEFSKLTIKNTILHFLSLLDAGIKDGCNADYFFGLKRQELFVLLFFYYRSDELSSFFRPILSKNFQFVKFVMDNYLSVKNVQELAIVANYSTSGFIKKFTKYFNEPPYQWIQKQKAKHILVEISQGIKSLQEIANEYKFSSYQHFSEFCKKQFGFPPTELSKRWK
jgi:AraC-like DNA-binding protein